MQTAKNLFTENWATRNFLVRGIQKFKKPLLLLRERNFTKDEIITVYLNTVAFIMFLVFEMHQKHFFKKNPIV
jgi:penicillin-binding protein 1A